MFNYLIYKLGQFLALYLPLKMSYGLAIFLSDLHFFLSHKDRHSVKNNLKIIIPGITSQELSKSCRQVFRNFGKYLVEFFRLPLLNKDFIKLNIKINNLEYVDRALTMGKGAIMVSAHMGNWELGGAVVSMLGYPVSIVVLPHKYKLVDILFNQQRISCGIEIISLRNTLRRCFETLKNNYVLGLLADRDFTNAGVIIDFLGKPTVIPRGAAVFSLKTGAPIVMTFFLREEDGTFTLSFEEPILPPNSSGDEEADLMSLIEKYTRCIETYIKKYPTQWLMFRKFWKQ